MRYSYSFVIIAYIGLLCSVARAEHPDELSVRPFFVPDTLHQGNKLINDLVCTNYSSDPVSRCTPAFSTAITYATWKLYDALGFAIENTLKKAGVYLSKSQLAAVLFLPCVESAANKCAMPYVKPHIIVFQGKVFLTFPFPLVTSAAIPSFSMHDFAVWAADEGKKEWLALNFLLNDEILSNPTFQNPVRVNSAFCAVADPNALLFSDNPFFIKKTTVQIPSIFGTAAQVTAPSPPRGESPRNKAQYLADASNENGSSHDRAFAFMNAVQTGASREELEKALKSGVDPNVEVGHVTGDAPRLSMSITDEINSFRPDLLNLIQQYGGSVVNPNIPDYVQDQMNAAWRNQGIVTTH